MASLEACVSLCSLLSPRFLRVSLAALLSRQFMEATRLRVEGLLAAFPKLISSDGPNSGKQHTFVETDNVR